MIKLILKTQTECEICEYRRNLAQYEVGIKWGLCIHKKLKSKREKFTSL